MSGLHPALFAAVLLAGCGSTHLDQWNRVTPEQLTARAGGLYVEPLRVVPPAAGECVGWVEVTIVNEGSAPVRVGCLDILQPDEPSGSTGRDAECGLDGPLFEMFDTNFASRTLEPGGACVVRNPFVRTRSGGPKSVRLRGQAVAFAASDVAATLTTEPVSVDLAEWPVPRTLTSEALDHALVAGHGTHIVFREHFMPRGGVIELEVRPDGSAHGVGVDSRPDGTGLMLHRAAGALTPAQQEALRAFVHAAPFSAFRVDPRSRQAMDGHVVRLLVAAGPAAFASWSQGEDFRAAGLTPLLQRLRDLLRELPGRPAPVN